MSSSSYSGGPSIGLTVINVFAQSTNSIVISDSITGAIYIVFNIKGTVSIANGGTFIPQYSLSAQPGQTYITNIGSYFKIYPISVSGSNTNIGSWA